MITTEKDKMLQGELYNASDPSLVNQRNQAKEQIYDYNHLRPTQTEEKRQLMEQLLGSCQPGFVIEQPFFCDYGYNIHIGTNFFANFNCTILDGAPVRIGDNVLLAPSVRTI